MATQTRQTPGRGRSSPGDERVGCGIDQLTDCVVVTAGGAIEQENASALDDALQVALEFSRQVIYNLQAVALVRSPAMAALDQAREQVRAQPGALVLVAANRSVLSVAAGLVSGGAILAWWWADPRG